MAQTARYFMFRELNSGSVTVSGVGMGKGDGAAQIWQLLSGSSLNEYFVAPPTTLIFPHAACIAVTK